jgi:monofunctional biosynthetic peptidoglycan transglycosylase
MARAGRQKRSDGPLRWLRRLALVVLLLAIVGPPLWVALYRIVPPPITILMIERLVEGRGLDRRWVPIGRIAPAMVRAVVASEDSRFCEHRGFDVRAINAALRHNARAPGRIRGGSTISQQTAKNVFLWPERSWVRKGAEAWFTVLIEAIWGKRRIMEVYLDTVEMGPGLYGVEAASQRYFHEPASALTPAEAGRLAAILPSPLKWKAAHPGPYVRRRTGRIEARSDTVARAGLAGCVVADQGRQARPISASRWSRKAWAVIGSG